MTFDPRPQIHYGSRLAEALLPPDRAAFTFGRHVFVRGWHLTPAQLHHELVHVDQFERWGVVGFLIRYWWGQLRHGYEGNPLEQEARGTRNGTPLARSPW